MGTPRSLTGTAVAKPNDPDSQIEGVATARARLERAALSLGVFVGEPTLESVFVAGRGDGYQVITLTAPILDTGSDEKVDTQTARIDPDIDRPA